MSKDARARNNFKQKIHSQNMMKKSNLYVTGFPQTWNEKNIKDIFKPYGEIASIKFDEENMTNPYAFVNFKTSESCHNAISAMKGVVFDNKMLTVNQYEIKELRQLESEEERDKKDWENYINAKNLSATNIDLSNTAGISMLIQQLMQMGLGNDQMQQPQQQ